MKCNQLLTLTLLGLGVSAHAQENQCPAPVDSSDLVLREAGSGIEVKALKTEVEQDRLAEFVGKVQIISDSAQINAQQARIDKVSQQLNASGNIRYQDEQIKVSSEDVQLDFQSGELSLDSTEYRMLGINGRGKAERIGLSREKGIELEDVSFTTCPAGQEDWQMVASSITLSPGDIWGEAKHARFYLMDIPVLYLPYFRFPVTDQRQTGLLFPQISSSDSTGLSYEQPIYWNIAENYDATFSPRAMVNRGVQLKTEFRYLTQQHGGQLDLEYLQHDRREVNEDPRYFYRFVHKGSFAPGWQVNFNINGISDDNYIVDLGSDFYNRADTHLYRNAGIQYHTDNLSFSADIRDFQLIGNHPDSYRALPELKLDYVQPWFANVDFNLHSELTYFDSAEKNAPAATRFHIAPGLSWSRFENWGEFVAETTLLQTNYRQQDAEVYGLEEDVSRTIGRARLYGGMTFERPGSWFGSDITQTLEPKIQYLYTSYQDQTNIGLYDTTRLQNNFAGLFRGQEFTGLDRISDTNQITLGLTSRFLDENDQEQFRLSLGQIFYLSDNRVLEAHKDTNRSALAGELDWRLGSKWFVHSEVQMDSASSKLDKSSLSLDYQMSENKLVQISHRYVRELSGEQIDQLGVTASWPINPNWHWVGRWYKDMNSHRTIESYAGVQYESCCWSIQFVTQRYLNNRFDQTGGQSTNTFESGIALKFIFKGMGSGNTARALLNDGLFGYRQPYFLNE
ncbi:LPS-assembly protein LptD [Neptunicella sp. SCSIO 80796]|uniref:LPS-assembly protein LptD n=1 Tax=Neptunicella plasticusilytica TaxID=3117012 RepID=UPI003A4D5C5A